MLEQKTVNRRTEKLLWEETIENIQSAPTKD